MVHLIEELKADHREILRTLEGIKEAGVTTPEGQRFYPAMRSATREGSATAATVESFVDQMRGISSYTLAFFEKYAGGGDGINFARDFGRLYATLWRRQQKEEKLLYPEYERVVA